jgi:hypothetical protein
MERDMDAKLYTSALDRDVVNFALFRGPEQVAHGHGKEKKILAENPRPVLQHVNSYTYKCSNYP